MIHSWLFCLDKLDKPAHYSLTTRCSSMREYTPSLCLCSGLLVHCSSLLEPGKSTSFLDSTGAVGIFHAGISPQVSAAKMPFFLWIIGMHKGSCALVLTGQVLTTRQTTTNGQGLKLSAEKQPRFQSFKPLEDTE